MNPREILDELDRLAISISHRPRGRGLGGQTISVGVGRERAYPELLRALEVRTPELLESAGFEASRHTRGTPLLGLASSAFLNLVKEKPSMRRSSAWAPRRDRTTRATHARG